MNRSLAFLPVLVLISITALGQTSVTGTVNAGSKPAAAASLFLFRAGDSTLVKTDITNDDGTFDIPLPAAGNYFMRCTTVGYDMYSGAAFSVADGEHHRLNSITLVSASQQLTDVTIAAKKPVIEAQPGKLVFNVENSVNATGSNVMELLQKSPGIMVDNNDNISMKGKTGVRIYIDGKLSQLDVKDLAAYLRTINSNDVEAIEMISMPGAKYDASGNAGIVNIRLKKNKKYGTNGNVSATYVQGISGKESVSLNLNYRDKKVNVFGNVNELVGMYENDLYLNRTQNDTTYDLHSANRNHNKAVNAKAGADFFLDSRNTVGVLLTGSYNDNLWTSASNTNIYYAPTGAYVKYMYANNNTPGHRLNDNFNLNYRFVDTNGREVNVDADYGQFRGTGNSLQPNYYYDPNNNPIGTIINRNITPTDIDIYTLKADAEQKLAGGKLGYGGKVSYVHTRNSSDFYSVVNNQDVMQADLSNDFDYTEQVSAAYGSYQYAFNQAVNMQAGLRVENTMSSGILTRADGVKQSDDSVKKNYTDLFPSASVSWNVDKNNALTLAYSRRIDRPTYQDLNPFERKLDELSYEKGNAFLRPQYTNNIELTHTFKGVFNTSLGYSSVKDYATQVTDTVGNASYVQQRNLATQNIVTAGISAPLPIRKWWNCYLNFYYSYQMFDGYIGTNKLNTNIALYGGNMQQTFTLPKNYTIELSGWYDGPSLWGATWLTKSNGGLDVGCQRQMMDKRLTVKISATDILFTAPWYAHNNFGGLKIDGHGNWESRTLRFSLTYRFGSSEINSARQRKTGMDSEQGRIKG